MKPIYYPWENEYNVFGIPKSLIPYPREPVHNILVETAQNYRHTGLIQNDVFIPYPIVKEYVWRFANALQKLGLKKGERVATILPTSIKFVIADYAISKAGLVHIPSSSLEPAHVLEQKFIKGKPKAVICLTDYLSCALSIKQKFVFQHLIVTCLDDFSDQSNNEDISFQDAAILSMKKMIHDHPPTPIEIQFDVAYDLESIIFTGGTTGLPKGCMLTHHNIYANCLQSNVLFGKAGELMKGGISVLLGLPFFHSYGHSVMHTMTLNGFNQILIPDARDSELMKKMILTHYPILHIGVPTQFMKIAEQDLKHVGRIGLSGSAPLPPSVQDAFEKKSGGGIMEGYGLSEMSPATHLNTSFFLRLFGGRFSVYVTNTFLTFPFVTSTINQVIRWIGPKPTGQMFSKAISQLLSLSNIIQMYTESVEKKRSIGIPCPDTQIKLLDIQTQQPLTIQDIQEGKKGELCLKGPQRMLGYWPEIGNGIDKDGYIHTGDIVQIDEKGYFYVVDRIKHMAIVSGFKVYTREIDDILMSHPNVQLAGTIGIPDPEREGSERIAVFVQPVKECPISENDIQNFLKERIAKYAMPKIIKIVDQMPLTPVEKIDKKVLKHMLIDS